MRSTCFSSIVLFAVAMTFSGCGGGGHGVPLLGVSGVAEFSGEPIADGEIRFVATDGARADAGKIVNGSLKLSTTAGAKRVEIYAVRTDPNNLVESAVNEGQGEPATEMYIPAKFHEKTELKAEVTSGGKNSFEFSLKS